MKILLAIISLILVTLTSSSQNKRTLRPTDYYRIPSVGSPQISPDGQRIVFTLTKADSALDKTNADLWMIELASGDTVQLTNTAESESEPRFSSDGRFISFLANRNHTGTQVWTLDLRGGEARKLTSEKGEISDYKWSPNSEQLLLVIKDTVDSSIINSRKPYVINRYHFKKDVEGYRYDTSKNHLYLFDIKSRKTQQLTSGNYNESNPAWHPSGKQIAFVSNRTEDPDKNRNTDIWIMNATPGATAKKLTTWKGADDNPRFSPNGKFIAYVQSTSDANSEYYEQPLLAVVPTEGGTPRLLSQKLDRPVFNHRWTSDNAQLLAVVADDTRKYIASFDALNGGIKKVAEGDRSFSLAEPHRDGSVIALMSNASTPTEIYQVTGGEVKRITFFHKKFIDEISLGRVEKVQSKSKDGTLVSSMVIHPPNENGKTVLPLVFYLHGGPVAQDEFSFDFTRQLLAAAGNLVAGVNYRGSTGRGHAYSHVITGDWGNKEVVDIIGAADELVKRGIADPKRIGVSGWSYGGMLTTYSIATDSRFKAAVSGAGVAFPLAFYGVDEYIMQYDNEIGAPWIKGNLEKYIRISYPFLHADRIKTPTLFMCGDKDFNVPITGSEQMYQALRSLGIPTEFVVYPGQHHRFTQPSFIVDVNQRFIDWFNKYLHK